MPILIVANEYMERPRFEIRRLRKPEVTEEYSYKMAEHPETELVASHETVPQAAPVDQPVVKRVTHTTPAPERKSPGLISKSIAALKKPLDLAVRKLPRNRRKKLRVRKPRARKPVIKRRPAGKKLPKKPVPEEISKTLPARQTLNQTRGKKPPANAKPANARSTKKKPVGNNDRTAGSTKKTQSKRSGGGQADSAKPETGSTESVKSGEKRPPRRSPYQIRNNKQRTNTHKQSPEKTGQIEQPTARPPATDRTSNQPREAPAKQNPNARSEQGQFKDTAASQAQAKKTQQRSESVKPSSSSSASGATNRSDNAPKREVSDRQQQNKPSQPSGPRPDKPKSPVRQTQAEPDQRTKGIYTLKPDTNKTD